MKIAALLASLIALFTIAGNAQKDSLIIYGKGFSFGVNEPAGWHCITEDAYKYGLNAYFLHGEETINQFVAIMHIRVEKRFADTPEKCLAEDMEKYRKKVKNIEFLEFDMGKLKYDFATKIYLIDNKTTDYICYITPYKESPLHLVFVLHGPKDECKKYEKDFSSIVSSFVWLTGNVKY